LSRWVTAFSLACAAIGAVSVLAFAVGPASPSSAESGDINLVAIDMDVTGNNTVSCAGQGCAPGTLGAIQTCGEIPSVGGTLDIDIVVDSIPNAVTEDGAGPNIQGYDMDLMYDPAIVEVSALPANGIGGPPANLNINYAGTPGGNHFGTTDHTPDSDGDFFMSEIDFGVTGESGPGILMRLTLKGVAAGTSPLTLGYTLLAQPFPNMYDNSGAQNTYSIGTVQGATIVVGGTCIGLPSTTPVTFNLTPSPSPAPSPTGPAPRLSATSSSNEGTPPGGTAAPESSGGSASSSLVLIIGGSLLGLCVLLGAAFLIMRGSRKQ
jgi:hypothetical protein